jgi:putative FmdB family regulatory protein
MPIYEYHCDDCEESFEVFVRSVSAPAHPACTRCGSVHVEKQITAFATAGGGDFSYGSSSPACAPSG